MLYQLYEAQRSLMEPFADFAQAASKLYGQGAPASLRGGHAPLTIPAASG